jgi:hypothetical protein
VRSAAHQLEDEIEECPRTIVIVRRRDGRWLASWSRAEAVLVQPLDPITLTETVADVLWRNPPEDPPL